MRKFFALFALLYSALGALGQEMAADTVPSHSGPVAEALLQKAEAGDAEAMNYLGFLLLSGEEGVERDAAAGLGWLVKAASAGDVKAASNLGWLFVDGSLVERDYERGAMWLSKAAGNGLPVALSLLGDLYRDGLGVEREPAVADSLYREALEGGLTDAAYKLFDLHKDEYEIMETGEKVRAGKYFYTNGAPSLGVRLFYLAAEEGNADALALLGDAYTRGMGVPYDYNLSLRYYTEAALAGNPSAQFVIGELLEIFPDALSEAGEGIPVSPQYWFENAARSGVSDAETATRRLLD